MSERTARKQSRMTDSQEVFKNDPGVEYSVRASVWLVVVDSEKLYYYPTTGRWRPTGGKKWYFSKSAEDFLTRVRRFQQSNKSKQV
ncbi:hypothetical protein NIES4106_39250 [Fischerella sp. NIES-4106]|nr:hypothetical protein NIES4106_39250 [Fischerella sp. NIES-4106]